VLMATSGKHMRLVDSAVMASGPKPPPMAQAPRDRGLA
jgi:hypothetical protein